MKNKLQDFPKVYYITLEESVERQKVLTEQFSRYKINPIPLISKRFSESNDIVYGDQLHILDSGTKGCVVSHLKMIKKWYNETSDEYAFFCEDDLSLETVDYWNFSWVNFIKEIPEDAECVQLCCIRSSQQDVLLRERTMYDWSVTAYILTRDYAKKIIERYCDGDSYRLEIPGTNFYPMPENVLFYGIGKVYALDLFVENIKLSTTFGEINGGVKEYHSESYEYISNWWKKYGHQTSLDKIMGKPTEKMKTEIENLLTQYSLDSENPENNFSLGVWYENHGHTAPALSYFLRCAERSEDKNLAYESLIRGHFCYEKQGTRDHTAKTLLQHALCLLPTRPEAYFLLAKFSEKRQHWQDCYIYASQGLIVANFDLEPLRTNVDYPGRYGLLFEKAISGWWWGKNEESGRILKELLNEHDLTDEYRNCVLDNLKKYFQHLLVPSDFDWGGTDPEYIEMFKNENFIDRVYERHYRIKFEDVVFDAGANCGSFTYSILEKNPKHVYCVEPSNTIINSLRNNVSHGPVTLINKAIADAEDDSKIIADSGVYIYQNDGAVYSTTTFKKIIEDYKIDHINFLKFDCEGGEYSIFTKENYQYIRNNIKNFAGEWHINDHQNAVERFIEFRDLYLKDCCNLHVYERNGKDVTQDIFDDQYLYNFREWWKNTYLGQFIIYFSYDDIQQQSVADITEVEKMDIVLQGQYENYTDEIIQSYLEVPFVDNVIVSCWRNDKLEEYQHSRVSFVRNEYPLTPGTCNKNLQIITSLSGIKKCRTRFSAKMRSDQKYTVESMNTMYEFLMKHHTDSKIFVGGIFSNLLFHPRDHIFWGKTDDLLYLFDIPLEYNSLIDKVRIGKYELAEYANFLIRPETYIGSHYCTRFDNRIKKMLIEPEKHLYDGCAFWNESHEVSQSILPSAFKSFPRTGIDFVWPKRESYSYPYEAQYQSGERWYEDGF